MWLTNRLPTNALPYGDYLESKTLYHAYCGHKPDLKSLRIFGCKASPVNIHRRISTYDPKILDEHIFVGMKGNRVWRLLNPQTAKEVVSTDVKFDEYQFPKLSVSTNKKAVELIALETTRALLYLPIPVISNPDDSHIRPEGRGLIRSGNTELEDT